MVKSAFNSVFARRIQSAFSSPQSGKKMESRYKSIFDLHRKPADKAFVKKLLNPHSRSVRFTSCTKTHDGMSLTSNLMELLVKYATTAIRSRQLDILHDYETRIAVVRKLDGVLDRIMSVPVGIKVPFLKEGGGHHYKMSSYNKDFLVKLINLCENWTSLVPISL